jgi:flagellar assembly protein FliH
LTDTVVHRVAFPVIADPAGRERASSADVRGHAAGYTAGLRAAQAETDALRARLEAEHAARIASSQADTARRIAVLDAATNAMLSTIAPVLADAEASVASAAMDLAEAVVGYAIRASRQTEDTTVVDGADGQGSREARIASGAEATVRRALASVDRTVPVAVRLSPADAARVADLALPVPVVADPALHDGDAVVDLPDGLLDARIATALDRARTALGVVGNEAAR